MPKPLQLAAGMRFGRLTVLQRVHNARGLSNWRCACECGAAIDVIGSSLVSGNTQSCDCLRRERSAAAARQQETTHGMSKSRVYRIWEGMRKRCESDRHPSFSRYGGRGIRVCERWQKFENFLADMGHPPSDDHSIDRKSNDGNYEPGNCVWATELEQQRNKSNNRVIEAFGERRALSAWAADGRCGISARGIVWRMTLGWSAEDAISVPRYGRIGGRAMCVKGA